MSILEAYTMEEFKKRSETKELSHLLRAHSTLSEDLVLFQHPHQAANKSPLTLFQKYLISSGLHRNHFTHKYIQAHTQT